METHPSENLLIFIQKLKAYITFFNQTNQFMYIHIMPLNILLQNNFICNTIFNISL